jgi:hypothetical protein
MLLQIYRLTKNAYSLTAIEHLAPKFEKLYCNVNELSKQIQQLRVLY